MSKQQYPAWQTTIRSAQAEQLEINAREESKAKQQKVEQDAIHGRNLARVLDVAFGIKLDTLPPTELFEMDGYSFRLKTYSSAYDDYAPTFYEKFEGDESKWISFTVWVNKVSPHEMQYDDLDRWPRSVELYTSKSPIGRDWTLMRAQLATALDDLKSFADYAIEQFHISKSKSPTVAQSETPKPLTIEDMIRSMVRAEVDKLADSLGMRGEF